MTVPHQVFAHSALVAFLAMAGVLAAGSPATSAAATSGAPPPGATPVALTAQPGTQLGRIARILVADDLAESTRSGEKPLLLVGSARLGTATDRPALFVQLQSPRECGSAGCSTSAYAWLKAGSGKGRWTKVLDSVNGEIAVAGTRHRGMADLVVNAERYTWTGTAYANTQPAPAVDLRPRKPRPPARAGS